MAFKGVPETLKDHPGLKNFNPRVCPVSSKDSSLEES